MSQYYQSTVSQLLHDSLIKLCQESVPFAHQLEVDGIICISPSDESNQIVVKVHEILNHLKPNIIVHLPPEDAKTKTKDDEMKDRERCTLEPPEKEDVLRNDLGNGEFSRNGNVSSDTDLKPVIGSKLNHSIRSLLSPESKIRLECSPSSSRRKGRKSASPCAIRNEVSDMSVDSEDEPCLLVNLPSQEIIPMSKKRSPQTSPRNDHSYTNHPKTLQTKQEKMDQLVQVATSRNSDISTSEQNQAALNIEVPMDYDSHSADLENADHNTPVACKYCGGEKYYDFNGLFEHNLRKHKKYTCKYCYNTFTMRCNLRRHEQLHSGIKPYHCMSCGRGFTRNNDLKIHETKHGCPTAPWWSECKACGLTFSRKRLFREHWCIGSMTRPGQTSGGSIVYQETYPSAGQVPSPTHSSSPVHEHYGPFHSAFNKALPTSQSTFPKFTFDQSNEAAWHFIQSEREAFQKQQQNQEKILIKVECPPFTPTCDFKGILQPSITTQHPASEQLQTDKIISNVLDISKPNKIPLMNEALKVERSSPLSETDHLASELVSALVGLSNTTAKYTVTEKSGNSKLSGSLLKIPGDQIKISYPIPNGTVEAALDGSSKKSPPVKQKRSPKVSKVDDGPATLPISDFTCPICKVTMDNFPDYDSHCETLHRRFACSVCGLTFSNRNNRARHVRTHTGERDFMCTECGKGFTRSDTLREHQIIHTDGYIVSKCDYCGMELEKKSELLAHIKRCLWYHKRAGKMAAQLPAASQIHATSQIPALDPSNEATWLFIQSEREALKKQSTQVKAEVKNDKKVVLNVVATCENKPTTSSDKSTSEKPKDGQVEGKI